MSEHYNALLADHLTRTLGVGWQARDRGADRNKAWEITGVPGDLIEVFSTRSHAIEVEKGRLIAAYTAKHGRRPSPTSIIKLRSQATLATRPDKTLRSLADLTCDWAATASGILEQDPAAWARRLLANTQPQPVWTSSDLSPDTTTQIGRRVVAVVGERRATWRRWNLHAEASRQITGCRFATTADREAVLGQIVEAAEGASLRLTPPALASVPVAFRRGDGTSVFRPKHSTVFTSAGLLAAEDRLLERSRIRTGPTITADAGRQVAALQNEQGRLLAADQGAAVTAVGMSGRVVDVLVGPAGAGKTTAMRALRQAWEDTHGDGSVIGLAPSAAAAQVLADDLGIPTENTAKWLHDQTARRSGLRGGQLVVIDEASLAGTHTLDAITGHAAAVGAKVLLVGDWGQLGAVEAGGAFALLVQDRDDAPELVDVRRFRHDWERHASVRLRVGDVGVIDTYHSRGRIREGDTQGMLDTAYQAWRTDIHAGRASVMIAANVGTMTALNTRARQDRMLAGDVALMGEVRLHDGTQASVGDLVITRRNDRRLTAGNGWVRNGDRWTVIATDEDGFLMVQRVGQQRSSAVRLPTEYVADHVELAYAITAHRAQGSTVDTAHTIVNPTMTRETLYVAMTRGRHANTAYVTIDQPDTEAHHQPHDGQASGRSVLTEVLGHAGAEQSAHLAIAANHEASVSIAQLAAEYETIAAAAQHDRWTKLIRQSGLTSGQAEQVITSEAFGPLAAALRRAEAHHHDVADLLPRLVAARPLQDADDIAAVLHHRLTTATTPRTGSSRPRRAPRLIAGLIPEAVGPMPPDLRQALAERKHVIEQRALALARSAISAQATWTRAMGVPPRDPDRRQRWARQVQIVAAYRDRHQVTGEAPLGHTLESKERRLDAVLGRTAITRAAQLASEDRLRRDAYASFLDRNSRLREPSL